MNIRMNDFRVTEKAVAERTTEARNIDLPYPLLQSALEKRNENFQRSD
jgi:hypothetical protein